MLLLAPAAPPFWPVDTVPLSPLFYSVAAVIQELASTPLPPSARDFYQSPRKQGPGSRPLLPQDARAFYESPVKGSPAGISGGAARRSGDLVERVHPKKAARAADIRKYFPAVATTIAGPAAAVTGGGAQPQQQCLPAARDPDARAEPPEPPAILAPVEVKSPSRQTRPHPPDTAKYAASPRHRYSADGGAVVSVDHVRLSVSPKAAPRGGGSNDPVSVQLMPISGTERVAVVLAERHSHRQQLEAKQQQQEEEAKKQQQQEEEAKKQQQQEEEAKKKQQQEEEEEEEAKKKQQQEEEAKKQQQEEEVKKKQQQEEETKKQQQEEEEAKKKQQQEEEAKKQEQEEEEAKKKQQPTVEVPPPGLEALSSDSQTPPAYGATAPPPTPSTPALPAAPAPSPVGGLVQPAPLASRSLASADSLPATSIILQLPTHPTGLSATPELVDAAAAATAGRSIGSSPIHELASAGETPPKSLEGPEFSVLGDESTVIETPE